ncbi:MAG: alanine dehydrogenase [Hyphomonadaceae bacterium]
MRVGVPREIKSGEHRVSMTPAGVRELTARGHDVTVEVGAGARIGFADADYEAAGASLAQDAAGVFAAADMIVKVKEPQAEEIARLKPNQILFTYLHLAPDPLQTRGLMKSGATCIAYETVADAGGRLPLLTPMSEVAGRLSVQVAAHLLEVHSGGRGLLLGGVTGVSPANVIIIGGGVAGFNAAQMALGMGAQVTIFDRSLDRLRQLEGMLQGRPVLLYPTAAALDVAVAGADLVVGAVLIPGAQAPKVLSRGAIARMRPGSVLVDISIDQGGCFETSRPTSHANPTYIVDDVTHYCVTNMPSMAALTATQALSTATLPFVLALAEKGATQAMKDNPHLAAGLNIKDGRIMHPEVRAALQEAIG